MEIVLKGIGVFFAFYCIAVVLYVWPMKRAIVGLSSGRIPIPGDETRAVNAKLHGGAFAWAVFATLAAGLLRVW